MISKADVLREVLDAFWSEDILPAPERHLMAFRQSMTALDFGGRLPPRVRVLYGTGTVSSRMSTGSNSGSKSPMRMATSSRPA
jgi:hypothetical protein